MVKATDLMEKRQKRSSTNWMANDHLVLTLLQAVLELILSSVVQREIQSLTSNQVSIEEAGTVYWPNTLA